MPPKILPTYAPNKVYTKIEHRYNWVKADQILNPLLKKRMIIWCADIEEQLGQVKEQGLISTEIIGPYRKCNKQKRKWDSSK